MYHAIVKRRVVATFAALNRGEYEPAIAGMAARLEHVFAGHHPLGGVRHSRDAMRLWFERLFRLNHHLDFDLKHIAVSGWPWDTTAIAEWTDGAELADGSSYCNSGVHIVRMRWGKIVSLHAYLDTGMWEAACHRMAQSGIEEASAPPIED